MGLRSTEQFHKWGTGFMTWSTLKRSTQQEGKAARSTDRTHRSVESEVCAFDGDYERTTHHTGVCEQSLEGGRTRWSAKVLFAGGGTSSWGTIF